MSVPSSISLPRDKSDQIGRILVLAYLIIFLCFMVFPLFALMSKSMQNADGVYVGLQNFIAYSKEPTLFKSFFHSLFVASASTAIVVCLGFIYAFALQCTCMRFKGFFRVVALIPLLSPSILAAIALVYWFGNQGLLKSFLLGNSIYGPIGIIMASVYWTFPHALMILSTSLSLSDARLYEASEALKASKFKTFLSVTLPGAKYGIISTTFVVFILVFTDFGVPKVIGGNYNVLATDIYREVVGMQNFQMGAVISIVLLIPALLAFGLDQYSRKRQASQLTSRSVVYVPEPDTVRDNLFLAYCLVITFLIVAMLGMAQFGALVKFWPYNLSLTLKHYNFEVAGLGWDSFYNSVRMSLYAAFFGTILIFVGSYLIEKMRSDKSLRELLQMVALMPMAIPGIVLGLAYIFFFNAKGNPLNFFYATMAILVINTIVHFYTVSHLSAITAIKKLDNEFEAVSLSLKIPIYKMFLRITLPVCLPTVFDIFIYLFCNAMTTVSGVIFLYSYDTTLASVSAIHLDEQGDVAGAAAMAMLIVYISFVVRGLHTIISTLLLKRTQAWRNV